MVARILFVCVVAACAGPWLVGCGGDAAPSAATRDAATSVREAATPTATTKDAGWGSTPPPDGTPPTFAPTFYAVYWEVLQPTCGTVFCHATDAYYELYSPTRAYETLVGAAASSSLCAREGLERVKPGHPEESLLFLKITDPPCGTQMPPPFGGAAALDPKHIEQIRRWILRGAPRDGGPGDRRTWDAGAAGDGGAGARDASLGDGAADAAMRDAAMRDAATRDAAMRDAASG